MAGLVYLPGEVFFLLCFLSADLKRRDNTIHEGKQNSKEKQKQKRGGGVGGV